MILYCMHYVVIKVLVVNVMLFALSRSGEISLIVSKLLRSKFSRNRCNFSSRKYLELQEHLGLLFRLTSLSGNQN